MQIVVANVVGGKGARECVICITTSEPHPRANSLGEFTQVVQSFLSSQWSE